MTAVPPAIKARSISLAAAQGDRDWTGVTRNWLVAFHAFVAPIRPIPWAIREQSGTLSNYRDVSRRTLRHFTLTSRRMFYACRKQLSRSRINLRQRLPVATIVRH